MISYVRGELIEKSEDGAVIEVSGVGYHVNMSSNAIATLPDIGTQVLVYTIMQPRDDAIMLYGFASKQERSLFERLVTVSGVGPKVALAALSSFIPDALARVISDGDAKRIATIPGIGKKTAQRIVLELKGVLDTDDAGQAATGQPKASAEARDALLSMGFTSAEIDVALKGYDDTTENGKDDISAIVKYALKKLGAGV